MPPAVSDVASLPTSQTRDQLLALNNHPIIPTTSVNDPTGDTISPVSSTISMNNNTIPSSSVTVSSPTTTLDGGRPSSGTPVSTEKPKRVVFDTSSVYRASCSIDGSGGSGMSPAPSAFDSAPFLYISELILTAAPDFLVSEADDTLPPSRQRSYEPSQPPQPEKRPIFVEARAKNFVAVTNKVVAESSAPSGHDSRQKAIPTCPRSQSLTARWAVGWRIPLSIPAKTPCTVLQVEVKAPGPLFSEKVLATLSVKIESAPGIYQAECPGGLATVQLILKNGSPEFMTSASSDSLRGDAGDFPKIAASKTLPPRRQSVAKRTRKLKEFFSCFFVRSATKA